MLDRVKRGIRRFVKKNVEREAGARIPEESAPDRPDEADRARPPADEFAVPVTSKERRHDGWSEIRPRRPGEDTDMGRDMRPDITDPGRDIDEERRRS